ncbi:MAG: hypothetical protein E7164_02695 [Firmicutes bacterium]|nr:hypothetical protein [Bacillota bacterium]
MKNNLNNSYLKVIAGYISEMYLPSISAMEIFEIASTLEQTSMQDIFEKIYIIYKNDIKVPKNDYLNMINKIYFYLADNNISVFEEDLDNKKVLSLINNEIRQKDCYLFEKITYPLFLFTKNLYFELIKNGAQKVYFFSREGQFMKKIFEAFQEQMCGPKVKTEYLYVSRASTFLGTLNSIDKENFQALFNQYPKMSIKTFLQNLDFTDDEITNLNKKIDLDFCLKIENIQKSEALKKVKSDKTFVELYNTKRKNAKNSFIKYLSSFGEDYQKELYVVDVGWKGTIQNNLQKILTKTKIHGYYLGLVHYDKIEDYEFKNSCLFEYSIENKTNNGILYNSNRSIFEVLLSADHGSTKNYEIHNDKAVPVLNNQVKEQELYVEKIKPIQENIYEKFVKISEILKYGYFDKMYVEKLMNKQFFKLMFKPSKAEVNEYNSFYHFENFGVMNYSRFNTAKKVTLKQKIKNYRHFRTFIQNDDSWQYLKLHNNKMVLGKIVLYFYKKARFKKMGVI